MRRIVFVATLLIASGVAFFFWSKREPSSEGTNAHSGTTADLKGGPGSAQKSPPAKGEASGPGAGTGTTVGPPGSGSATSYAEADFPLAARLNAPNASIAQDLDIISQIFETWQSNFPREGNPVGENADITAALMGQNAIGLALIPKEHRAVNAEGELCDRWGTPFRFHQLSGTKMEIRSAGPDRRFATDDDAVWTPQ